MEKLVRSLRAAMLGSVALGAPLSWAVRGRPGVAFACLGALASSQAVPALARRRGLRLAPALELLWLAPFVACWGLGEGWALFEKIGWWDSLTHAVGAAAIYGLWAAWGEPRLSAPALWRRLAGVAIALAVGALWEIGEFASDTLLHTFTQNGNTDTMLDLIFDFGGGVAAAAGAAALAWLRTRRIALGPLRAVEVQR